MLNGSLLGTKWVIMAKRHALAGVFIGIMAITANVDQSRVNLALLAVIDPNWVTPGAVSGVPTSGCMVPYLTGQATS